MRKLIIKVLALITVVVLIFVPACGGEEKSEAKTGIIILGVTDKPDESITGIVVTTNLIEANVRAEENEESEWQVLLDSEQSFDLIKVAGIEDILGETNVPAATYNQIRMHVKSVTVALDGQDIDATVPSGILPPDGRLSLI